MLPLGDKISVYEFGRRGAHSFIYSSVLVLILFPVRWVQTWGYNSEKMDKLVLLIW